TGYCALALCHHRRATGWRCLTSSVLKRFSGRSIPYHARLRLNNATRLSRIDWLWSAKRASVGPRRNRRRVKQAHPLMRIYIIGSDGIALCHKAPATLNDGEIAVASNEELHAAPLSAQRLLALW